MTVSRRTVSQMILSGAVLAALGTTVAFGQAAPAAFQEGRHYTRLTPAVPQSTPPGTVEVTEVFSYGCPACWQALPAATKLKKSLPPKAQMTYVHASWIQAEAWPMFQRMHVTAQAMGIADKTHEQVFDAVWRTNEIPLRDPATGGMAKRLPTIEDAAKFYARVAGIKAEDFVATSKSFAVETRLQQVEKLIRAYRADSTPTFVVAGKWKVESRNTSGYDEVIAIARFLVDKELAALPAAAPAAAAKPK